MFSMELNDPKQALQGRTREQYVSVMLRIEIRLMIIVTYCMILTFSSTSSSNTF